MGEMARMIFTKEQMARLNFLENGDVSVDVHGLDRAHCKKFLRDIITLNRGALVLRVIHGYNNGTRLRDMIRYDNVISRRIVGFDTCGKNEGITLLNVVGV